MRGFLGALMCAAVLAQPVGASNYTSSNGPASDEIPVILDAFIMRPIGLGITAMGFTTWALFTPIMAMTRPTDMHKTFKSYVINPARFTFVDPIGFHPDRVQAEKRGEIR